MKKTYIRIISFLLLAVMLFSAFLTSCSDPSDKKDDVTTPSTEDGTEKPTEDDGGEEVPEDKWQIPEGEYTIPKEPGHNQITFYWSHPGVIALSRLTRDSKAYAPTVVSSATE